MLSSQAGWHSGTLPATISSSDPVGIRRLAVTTSTGIVLASATQPCDYTYTVPCPQANAVPLVVDTTRLPDGVDRLTLVATDPAQNTATSTVDVMVANRAPPAPVLTGVPAGVTAQTSASVTARVASGGVPITALDWMVCSGSCQPANVVPVPAGAGTVSFTAAVPGSGHYALEAYAVDAAGHRSATASAPFDVAVGGRPPGPTSGQTVAGNSVPVEAILPSGPTGRLTLPAARGRGGVRLRLTLQRRPHGALALDVATRPRRAGRVIVRLAFAGHRTLTHRLTLRHGAAGFVGRIPGRASALSVAVVGFGTKLTAHVRLARG